VPPLDGIGPRHRVRCFEWRATPPLEVSAPPDLRAAGEMSTPLLKVEGLRASYDSHHETVVAATDISFELQRAECLAIVGESGSGKTTVARCIVGLHEPAAGRIMLDDEALPGKAKARSLEARRRIQIVFQNPADSLNPRRRIGAEVTRPARILRGLSADEAVKETAALLERVRLPAALAGRFPGELSGGELQRVAIARALSARPDLLVCDEITSALDVSVQAAVLDLLGELRNDLGLAILFISHDLGVVASIADRILVLESGNAREEGPTTRILSHPQEDYTRSLLEAAPRIPQFQDAAEPV
jgi:peptide/nickel transport system ATP-binding protein